MADPIKINRGQIWADKDPREAKNGKRQRLVVLNANGFDVTLYNEDTKRHTAVRTSRFRSAFRLVEDVTEERLAHLDRGARLEQTLLAAGVISEGDPYDSGGYDIDFERLADLIAERLEQGR